MNMTLDEEMKVWEDRSNDEFGKILQALKELTKDYFVSEEDEYGINSMPLDVYIAQYSVFGRRKSIALSIRDLLENYDILDNDEAIDSLVNELENLS